MKRFANFAVQYRKTLLSIIGLVSLFFFYQCLHLKIATSFNDLIPPEHPFIKVHAMTRSIFGGANQVLIMLQVRSGDVFNRTTLEKLQHITREAEKVPGVDPYKIRSLASSKMKDFKFSSGEMEISTLMYPDVPQNAGQMQQLKDKVFSNPRYYGQYVSYDSKKALVMIDFLEEEVDNDAVFNFLQQLRSAVEDDNHILSIAGEPMHMGYIASETPRVLILICITALAVLGMLFMYYSARRSVFMPLLAAGLSAIWGLGFMSLLGYVLDPLVLVLPFLIALMTVPHAMQCISRFYQEFKKLEHMPQAAARTIETMFLPGLAGVLTDALGIALVGIAGIPVLEKIAIVSIFWCAVSTVILALLMTPLLLSLLPETENMRACIERRSSRQEKDRLAHFLGSLGTWICGRGKKIVAVITLVVAAVGLYFSQQIQVGDFMPGSSILWPWHRYNKDAFRITFSMPLLNPLYVIVAGNTGGYISQGSTLREMDRFQRYIARHDRVMFTYSIVNPLPPFYMSSNEDDPQWCHLPREDRVLSFIARRLLYTGEPGTWDRYVDMQDRFGNIVVYCRDKMPATVQSIIAHIKTYIEKTPGPPGGAYLLAGGPVGVQAAVRDVIADAQVRTLVYALAGVFLICAVYFRSLAAGLLLVLPIIISNILVFALMGAYHIGLTVNTFPVSCIGIGLGVDYGIYLMSRLREERGKSRTLEEALSRTFKTNGRTVIQVASTLTVGLLCWAFSALRFQAEMGILLAAMLFLNMLGAIFVLPSLVCFFKPKFIVKGN